MGTRRTRFCSARTEYSSLFAICSRHNPKASSRKTTSTMYCTTVNLMDDIFSLRPNILSEGLDRWTTETRAYFRRREPYLEYRISTRHGVEEMPQERYNRVTYVASAGQAQRRAPRRTGHSRKRPGADVPRPS